MENKYLKATLGGGAHGLSTLNVDEAVHGAGVGWTGDTAPESDRKDAHGVFPATIDHERLACIVQSDISNLSKHGNTITGMALPRTPFDDMPWMIIRSRKFTAQA